MEKPKKDVQDNVNHPDHYTYGKIECLEAIEASLSPEAFKGFLKGNSIKYLWRYEHKGNSVEDLKKSMFYTNKLLDKLLEEVILQEDTMIC